jgi:hypothetical protein
MTNVIPLRPDEPRRIGRYRLTGRVGDHGAVQEGAGGTFTAQRQDGELVTVTLLSRVRAADAAAKDRFMAEARAARQVPPFCAARILDAGFEGIMPYLVAEFVPGDTLTEATFADGPLADGAVRGVAAGAATGLAAIHQAGLVHGNFGPDTLVLGPGGPRIVYFSITPPYGNATPAADMLAWAQTVLYAAVGPPPAGRAHAPRPGHPGPGYPASRRYGQRELAVLPAGLRAVVARCLSPDPAGRPTAREVLTELLGGRNVPAGLLAEGSRVAQAAARTQPAAPPATPARHAPRRPRTAAVLWVAGCAACLLAIVAAVAYIAQPHSGRPAASPTASPSHSGPPPDIPASLTGSWSGVVRQTHPVLSVVVRLSLGKKAGSISYPALKCSGSLAVQSVAPARLVVKQTIAAGQTSCENGVITLTPLNGKLEFRFGSPGSNSPTGTLTRQR